MRSPASISCPSEVAKHVKVVQERGQGADEIFGGYHWYPPLMHTNDAVETYANVYFDRDHASRWARRSRRTSMNVL